MVQKNYDLCVPIITLFYLWCNIVNQAELYFLVVADKQVLPCNSSGLACLAAEELHRNSIVYIAHA